MSQDTNPTAATEGGQADGQDGSGPAPLPVRTSRRSRTQRQAILNAATEIFGENGYLAATMDQVAERLQVTKPAIYYHFRNKEDLYVEVRVSVISAGVERTRRMLAHYDSPLEALRAVASNMASASVDPMRRAVTLVDSSSGLSAAAMARIQAEQARYRGMIRGLIERGISEGVFAQGDSHIMTLVFIDALQSLAKWYRPEGRLPRDRVIQEVVARAIGTVLPTSESPTARHSVPEADGSVPSDGHGL